MISCLFCGVSLLYAYFVSKKILLLFIAILMFLLAAGCHQVVVSKVRKLEETVDILTKTQNETNKFMNCQVRINEGVKQTLCKLGGITEDDLK